MVITTVRNDIDDWEGLYINNKLKEQGHSIDVRDVLSSIVVYQHNNPDDTIITNYIRIWDVDMVAHDWDYLPDNLEEVLEHYGK